MIITSWPSPAKINLFLYINNRRSDGYHNLQTLYQFLNYGDTLHISVDMSNKITLLTSLYGILDKKNLILNSAKKIQKIAKKRSDFKYNYGANIFIDKYIPIGSGLGGGSSNAATTLVALNYLWNVGLNLDELVKIGLELGSDIPFFIKGHSAFAEGKGEIIQNISINEKWYLIIYPNINISTSKIFKNPFLKRDTLSYPLKTLLSKPFYNDCESIVRKKFHKIDTIINYLSKYAPTRLTGTGSCIFSEFESELEAKNIFKIIPKWTYGFIAKGCNNSFLNIVFCKKIYCKNFNFLNQKNYVCSLFNNKN